MAGSNYPPGVTGNEYPIAGPDEDWDEDRYCPPCDQVIAFIVEKYHGDETAYCGRCGWVDESGNWDVYPDELQPSDDGGGWD